MSLLQDAIRKQLDENRRELLDLSTRNRLISLPINSKSARLVQVFDEKADETFKKLIGEKKLFTFLPGKLTKRASAENGVATNFEETDEELLVELPLPEEDEVDEGTGLARRHSDSKLQTRLTAEVLQRRLFDLYNESRTLIEEQGVNVLYLAVGFVKWTDKTNGHAERYAPILLIPVDLVRKSAAERFAIKWREEDLQENLSLAEKFRIEYGISLPAFSLEDPEGFDILCYFSKVEQAIHALPGWAVEPDGMCLGFFSFAKFLMYRDLDATTWPAAKSILNHPLVGRLLLTDQAETALPEPPFQSIDIGRLDQLIPAERLDHVVDADSSQTVAIELVRAGHNLVIQGPPGTGKSQTITNLIATAVLDGKKVLFVAEKLAALEVVKRRLEREHLGVLCLELHSNKARKADIAANLKQTWELGKPAHRGMLQLNQELEKQRSQLNTHPERLHKPLQSLKQTAFDFIGLLAREGRPEGKEIGVRFMGAESWNEQQLDSFRNEMHELKLRLERLGPLRQHSWRGVRQTVYYGTERQLFLKKLGEWHQNMASLQLLAGTLAGQLQLETKELTMQQANRLHRLAHWASARPQEKIESIGNSIWEDAGATLVQVAQNKSVYERIVQETKSQVLSSIWKGSISIVRQQLVLHGQKWYKFFIGSYRKAMSMLQAELAVPLPKRYAERLALVEKIQAGQEAYQIIAQRQTLAREAFGVRWEVEGNTERLLAAAQWVLQGVGEGFSARERESAQGSDISLIGELARQQSVLLKRHDELFSLFSDKLLMEWSVYHPSSKVSSAPNGLGEILLAEWQSLLASWMEEIDSLADWIAAQKQLQQGKGLPVAPLVELAENGSLSPASLLVSFNRIWAQQCLEHIFKQEEGLASFDGVIHEQKVEQFRQLDQQRLHLAKFKVLDAHYTQMPEKKAVGMVGTVLAETNKQRNHKPIRKLLREAGTVVQNLKPVFMMSPLSVAQFLEPGVIEFDLLVIDEASQVQPVDALGAVARAKQIVVVGDDKQLPPTTFFAKITSNGNPTREDEGEEGQVQAKELESILSLCKARGIGDTLLRWHYRSRHESLIAVSNQRYYENKLFIVPSPWKENAELGLKWRQVDGHYDRSGTRANAKEAKQVALAVLRHARQQPQQTLGVAAFSMSQQRAIQDEVEVLRRHYPTEMEAFFARHPHEPFFVKNLENVQGDERDVIFLSVGYGKDAEGQMFQNFGPLNRIGGERRLNVLISRAKKCCEVFSSITEQDIVLTDTTREGVVGLKHFLRFARTGIFDLAQSSGPPVDRPLEEAVKTALEQRFGWEVHTQVGVAGFFIDLALVDPDRKGRYVLGIECDGVDYYKSPSARERDRLRQSVLESQGWVVHRLWGVDFFRRPGQELAKVKAAYEQALAVLEESDAVEKLQPAEEPTVFQLLREQEEKSDFTVPYQVARNIVVPCPDPYELYPAQLSEIIHQILTVEAPIHFDELVTRMREQWGWSRAADRFRSHITEGLNILVSQSMVALEADFIHLPAKGQVQVRKRDQAAPAGTRKSAYIPPVEIDLALELVTRAAHRLSREEAAKEVSTALGFKSLSGEFRNLIDTRINLLLQRGTLTESEGRLTI